MTKAGLDYVCNKCHKPEFGVTDSDFADTPDVDLINDLRAELDEEARMENEDEKGNPEIDGHIEDRKGGGIYE